MCREEGERRMSNAKPRRWKALFVEEGGLVIRIEIWIVYGGLGI